MTFAHRSRVFASDCGWFGYVPDTSFEGDHIVIFYGVAWPLVLRESPPSHFTIIGPAYVYGAMDGEFIREENPGSVTFLLL